MSNYSLQYGIFASFYDKLMDDSPDYDGWTEFLKSVLDSHNVSERAQILDLACGTGEFTNRLALLGYDMIGVDLSGEMLALAREKASGLSREPLFLEQDMRYLDLYGTVDAVVCCLDSINYLLTSRDLAMTFERVKLFLPSGAPFIFDVNTKYKFENELAQNAYVYESDGVFCTWENFYNPKTSVCDFRLTFFEEGRDGKYRRYEENQKERMYTDKAIKAALKKAGFSSVSVYGDLDFSPLEETSTRAFYIAIS